MKLFSIATEPAEPSPERTVSVPGIVEWILKDPEALDAALRDRARLQEVASRCLTIALLGFTVFGVALSLVLHFAPVRLDSLPRVSWGGDLSALALIAAYDLGLIAACGICLPSFYFYGLLGGIATTMQEAAAHAARCLAVTAVMLMGLLPCYVAVALGGILIPIDAWLMRSLLALGLVLPFVAGLWGVAGLRDAFMRLAEERAKTPAKRIARKRFVGRLLLAWAGVYTAVTPVMIWTLWSHFAPAPP
jgi:hypothetical protein